MLRNFAKALSLGILCFAVQAEDSKQSITVYVQGRNLQILDEAQRNQLFEDARTANNDVVALSTKFNQRYGKEVKSWPPEASDQLAQAQSRQRQAALLAKTVLNKQADVDDSLADLKKSLAGKKMIRLVAAPDQAEVQIELLGRYKEDNHSVLYIKLTSGKMLNTAFWNEPGFKRPNVQGSEIRNVVNPTPESPALELEVIETMLIISYWKEAASRVPLFSINLPRKTINSSFQTGYERFKNIPVPCVFTDFVLLHLEYTSGKFAPA